MDKDEIISMAQEAGFTDYYPERLTRFASLVAAHEREACLSVVHSYRNAFDNPVWDIEEEIRRRK